MNIKNVLQHYRNNAQTCLESKLPARLQRLIVLPLFPSVGTCGFPKHREIWSARTVFIRDVSTNYKTTKPKENMDIVNHNKSAWDDYVDKKDPWTIPVSEQELENAKNGNWKIVLTPNKSVPHNWFPDLKGLKILGLASGGGQQGPILAILGADVTIFDNSEKQLRQDKILSDKFDLDIKIVQGDMNDLSVFADNSFDLIFNPCSVVFVENVLPVWKECFRVLKPNGILMTGLINPISFQLDEENLNLIYQQPYSDLHSLKPEKLEELKKNNEALEFGHSLTDQIGGQLETGFTITAMFEDSWGGENKIDEYLPCFIATRAIKRQE